MFFGLSLRLVWAGLGWSLSALTSVEFLLEAEYVLYDTLILEISVPDFPHSESCP